MRRCAPSLALVLALACSPYPGGLLVVVDTDFEVPAEVASLHVTVERIDTGRVVSEDFALTGRDLSSEGDRSTLVPLSFAVRAPDPLTEIVLTVEGRDESGTVLVTRRVQTGFIAGTTRALPIFLARACATGALECSSELECNRGSCVPRRIDPMLLDPIENPNEELDASEPQLSDGGACADPLDCEIIANVASASISNHTCALTTHGDVACWGRNNEGQLGTNPTLMAVRPIWSYTDADAAQVATGGNHTCVRRTDGTVACWGRNFYGQLGDGTSSDSREPVRAGSIATAREIAAGDAHTCARLEDGTVLCWGRNEQGQVRAGTASPQRSPVVVGLPVAATQIVCGRNFTCALLSTGDAMCWGDDADGALGDGTATSTGPVAVQLSNIEELSAGASFACARAQGSVACWGANADHQVSAGGPTQALPVAVDGLPAAVQIRAGGAHACVRQANGVLTCWGRNTSGQLGVGTTSGTGPALSQIQPVADVVGGGNHTCATGESGAFCWGNNLEGQLGDGTSSNQPLPVAIAWPP